MLTSRGRLLVVSRRTTFLLFFSRHMATNQPLQLTTVLNQLQQAGEQKNTAWITSLWFTAEQNDYNSNPQCSREFLYWFSQNGKVNLAIDALSKLIPNVTTEDTLCLLQAYHRSHQPEEAEEALQLLIKVPLPPSSPNPQANKTKHARTNLQNSTRDTPQSHIEPIRNNQRAHKYHHLHML